MKPAVYILTNSSRTVLYTGVTSNLAKRLWTHRERLKPCFTKMYLVDRLVYFEEFQLIHDAIDREKMIKKKSRRGKVKLIESLNPEWNDLAEV